MLRQTKDKRTLKQNLMLASSTAFVAGVVNVGGLLAFLAFTSNVTGHVANLAKHIAEQDVREVLVFGLWLFMFMMGAFMSSFIIRSYQHISNYKAHSIPIIIEIFVLLFIAVYGHNFYAEARIEREIVISAVLFAMGLQNGLVSNISGGLVKTTHLTGLFTDLGSELSDLVHPRTRKTKELKGRILIRLTILSFYILGGAVGGILFNIYEFTVFYFVPVILLTILYYDLLPVVLRRISQLFSSRDRQTSNN